MKNDFWIFCKTKTCRVLIIDIYDPCYMERPREERFSEQKSLLAHNIMSVKKVYVQYTYTITELKLKADWVGIERIVEIHHLLERLYPQITPLPGKNAVLYDGTLELDERYDNSHLPHYKVARQKRNYQRNKHKEGEVFQKDNGEAYIVVYGQSAVSANWYGKLGRGKYLKDSEWVISTGTNRTTGWIIWN